MEYSKEDKLIIANEIRDGNRSFINDGGIFHISGAKVDFDREYARAKKEFNETNKNLNSSAERLSFPDKGKLKSYSTFISSIEPLTIKALADRKRAITYGRYLIDIIKLKKYGKEDATKIIINNRKQSGINRSLASYNGFDTDYLKANALSILNNEAMFSVNGKQYFTDNGKERSSITSSGSPFKGYTDHDVISDDLLLLNSKDNLSIISEYHKRYGIEDNCSSYTVIDKKASILRVLDKNKNVLFESEILIGENEGDQRTIYRNYSTGETNNRTGAGIYNTKLEDKIGTNFNRENFTTDPLFLSYTDHLGEIKQSALTVSEVVKTYKDRYPLFGNGDLTDNRTTNAGIVMTPENMKAYASFKKKGCPFYVLPTSNKLKFKIEEDQLIFQPKSKSFVSNSRNDKNKMFVADYNFSAAQVNKSKKIKVILKDNRFDSDLTKKFLSTLESEKVNLMKQLNLTNAEYNELAKLSFGVIGTESGFGTEQMFKVKESTVFGKEIGQWFVDITKGNIIQLAGSGIPITYSSLVEDNPLNSRGLPQIKNIKSYLKDNYPNINGSNLNEPENAAVATMYVLASKLQTLKKIEANHPAITESNRMEYLYYVYMGSANQIIEGSATPRLNPKVSEVLGYSRKITILTRP